MATHRRREPPDRKQTDEELHQALQRVRFHVARMPLAHIVWDADFCAEEWNPAAERTFGYAAREAVGKHAYALIVPPDAQPEVDKVWAELLAGDESSHSINANVCKDGTRIRCEWFNTPLRDASGKIVGVASMAQDISERELLEAQLRRAQKLESLGVLAGGVAHDFNNLLTIMLGNAALLRKMPELPETARQHLSLIESAADRASGLTGQLLRMGRTDTHELERVEINRIVRGALKLVRSAIAKSVKVRTELAGDLPPIQGDRAQIEQVIMNLCMNASDAMPEGGIVTVQTRMARLAGQQCAQCVPASNAAPGRRVELGVIDTGVGMSASTAERIFDPFFTTRPDGHGLGMAAVLGILAQHGACARVDSTLGKGTSIHVYFPIAAVRTSPRKRAGSKPGLSTGSVGRRKEPSR